MKNHNIPQSIEKVFGRRYIFHKDNATPHKAVDSMLELYKMFPAILDWPPESPDLSPIENIWNFLKDKLSDNLQLYQPIKSVLRDISSNSISNLFFHVEQVLLVLIIRYE